eukprot:CAMPEP_0202838650 /NCGR_PEP_ID=MMETSP1389-20130828/50003_1 /ASSEMBLY_ACC=CAM_ASM_000865 /TAXON_ID=302021 /ORGANISM="Rhodomonas sp., Strain CCMP768" /LENGTH=133 /DNA_ID=CAMNT_0049514969 /DNA_START=23 /DNA_END=420 /DNA_ORIENTATION=-
MSLVQGSPALRDKYGTISQKRESEGNKFMFSVRLPDTGVPLAEVQADFAVAVAADPALRVQICVASVAYTAGSTVTNSGGAGAGDRCVFLDVLPFAAGKGNAHKFARERILSIPADRCIVRPLPPCFHRSHIT